MTPHIPNPTNQSTGAVPTPVTPAHSQQNNSRVAKIHARKILVKGEPHFEITGFDNILNRDELPYIYQNGYPWFFLYGSSEAICVIINTRTRIYRIGDRLIEREFHTLISTLKQSGERLTKINADNKQRAKKFDGTTITITI